MIKNDIASGTKVPSENQALSFCKKVPCAQCFRQKGTICQMVPFCSNAFCNFAIVVCKKEPSDTWLLFALTIL